MVYITLQAAGPFLVVKVNKILLYSLDRVRKALCNYASFVFYKLFSQSLERKYYVYTTLCFALWALKRYEMWDYFFSFVDASQSKSLRVCLLFFLVQICFIHLDLKLTQITWPLQIFCIELAKYRLIATLCPLLSSPADNWVFVAAYIQIRRNKLRFLYTWSKLVYLIKSSSILNDNP